MHKTCGSGTFYRRMGNNVKQLSRSRVPFPLHQFRPVMRGRCREYDDCDIVRKEDGIAFFRIEGKKLLLQNKVAPYAARNKCVESVGADRREQRMKRNRLKSRRLSNIASVLLLLG